MALMSRQTTISPHTLERRVHAVGGWLWMDPKVGRRAKAVIRNGYKFDIKINPGEEDWEWDLIRYISIVLARVLGTGWVAQNWTIILKINSTRVLCLHFYSNRLAANKKSSCKVELDLARVVEWWMTLQVHIPSVGRAEPWPVLMVDD